MCEYAKIENIKLSLDKSTYGVMQKKVFGGHDITDKIIEYNFDEGICNLFTTISQSKI